MSYILHVFQLWHPTLPLPQVLQIIDSCCVQKPMFLDISLFLVHDPNCHRVVMPYVIPTLLLFLCSKIGDDGIAIPCIYYNTAFISLCFGTAIPTSMQDTSTF